MTTHPIFDKWPAAHPDRLQLFGAPTPNGVKVSIMLEECGLPYEAHRVDIMANESHDPAFLALNPNGKIPAIYDPDGPGGKPLALFESGAILIYLADKAGRFLPADPGREERQIERLRGLAAQADLDPEFSEKFLRFIIDEVIRHHEQLRG